MGINNINPCTMNTATDVEEKTAGSARKYGVWVIETIKQRETDDKQINTTSRKPTK